MQERWGSLSDPGDFFLLWVIFKSLSLHSPRFPEFIFWAVTFYTVWKRFLGGFFPIGLCWFQHKGSRFILRLMDHYNIDSVASLCGCDMSLSRCFQGDWCSLTGGRHCHVSWHVSSAPWGIYEELGPQHRWLKPVIILHLLSGKHRQFKSSSGNGSGRTFFCCNHQGAIATPTGH